MKKILILAILILGMFLIGCEGGTTSPTETPFIGGSNGLIQSFIPGAPPEEIFDDSQLEFSIITQLENVGEDDIEEGEGYIKIHGILANDYGLSQDDFIQDIPKLSGARKNTDGTVTSGDITTVEFVGLRFMGSVPGTLQAGPVRVEACYNYETEVSSQLCVREKLITEGVREICEPSGVKSVANSGAPLRVTNLVEQPLAEGKIRISFQIESAGQANDRFYKMGTECDDDLTNRDRYKVYVEIGDVSGVTPKCELEEKTSDSSGYRTLWDGKPQTVSCTLDFGNIQTTFQPFIEINLKYRYSQFIETGLLVKDISVEEESTPTTLPPTTTTEATA